MKDILQYVVGKVSSYNIFNNFYPGIIFCYLLKLMFNVDLLIDNWFVNLFVFYFVGMVLSRIGSVVIEPLLVNFKIGKKQLMKTVSYSDYESASAPNPFVVALNEERNVYRSLLACFVCLLSYKVIFAMNTILIKNKITFISDNKDWIILYYMCSLLTYIWTKQHHICTLILYLLPQEVNEVLIQEFQ